MAMIKGTASWAAVYQPNTRYTPRWQIDLAVSDEDAEHLQSLGVKGKKDERGNVFKITKNQYKKDGSLNTPPQVFGPDAEPFDDSIGNGSEVIVSYTALPYAVGGNKGVKLLLNKLQVIKHVKYDADDFVPVQVEDTDIETSVSDADDRFNI